MHIDSTKIWKYATKWLVAVSMQDEKKNSEINQVINLVLIGKWRRCEDFKSKDKKV